MSENEMVSTKKASQVTKLPESELRKGWKQGRYPALEIGSGRGARLRWNIGLLEEAIREQMLNAQVARQESKI